MGDLVGRVNRAMGAEHVDNCEHDHIGELESAVDELQARLRDAEATIGEHLATIIRYQSENATLRAHSGRLVELLSDAWWVEAAEHLQELRMMTTEGSLH